MAKLARLGFWKTVDLDQMPDDLKLEPTDTNLIMFSKIKRWTYRKHQNIHRTERDIVYWYGISEQKWDNINKRLRAVRSLEIGVLIAVVVLRASAGFYEKKLIANNYELKESRIENRELRTQVREFKEVLKKKDDVIAEKDRTINTLVEQHYFPVFYDELPRKYLKGIVFADPTKETIEYEENETGMIRKYILFVYKINEAGCGLVDLISLKNLALIRGQEINATVKVIPHRTFDIDPIIYTYLNGKPKTKMEILADYIITPDLLKAKTNAEGEVQK